MSRRPTAPVRRRTTSRPPEPPPPRTGNRPRTGNPARTPSPQRAAPSGRLAPAAGSGGTPNRRRAVVSATSAARFAARSRQRRRVALKSLLAVLGAVTAVALAGWIVLVSPLLAVREISVVGADRVEAATVTDVVAAAVGSPLARADTSALEDSVAALPLVNSADVVRVWPDTLEVRLVERVPVAAVPAPAGGVRLVDADGVVVAEAPQPPPDLPLVHVDVASAGAATLRAATEVLAAMPEELRADVETIGASSPDDVRLTLRDGAAVVWGAPTDHDLKAQVLAVLRGTGAAYYDVSAPLAPVTR